MTLRPWAWRLTATAAMVLSLSATRSPEIPYRDPHDRRRGQRDRRDRRHQPRRPAGHRLGRILVRGAGVDAAPLPRAQFHSNYLDDFSDLRDRRRWRRLSRHRLGHLVRQEDLVVQEPGQGRRDLEPKRRSTPASRWSSRCWSISTTTARRRSCCRSPARPARRWLVRGQGRRVGQACRQPAKLRSRHRRRRRQRGRPQRHPDAARLARSAGRSAQQRTGRSIPTGRRSTSRRRPPRAAATPAAAAEVTELGFMHVIDVNGDGRNDIVTAAAHDYGVFWFEQGEGGKWTRRDDRQRVVAGARVDAGRSQRRRPAGSRHRQALHGAQRQRPR